MNKRQSHERAVVYAKAYIAWVDCLRWSIEPRDWWEKLGEGQQFTATVREMLPDIQRSLGQNKRLVRRVALSSRLAHAMYNHDFRAVFENDRLLRAISE